MDDRPIVPEWWTEFSQVVLHSPKLTQAVIETVESDETAFLTKHLAEEITDRRRELEGEGSLPEDGRYERASLSTDLKERFEPLGLTIRPAKAVRSDQSIIYTVGWITDFLAKQNLEEGKPVDWSGNDELNAMMEYVLDVSTDETIDYRHPVPLEAVVYTYATRHATVGRKDVHVEIGDPATFSERADSLAETLYEGGDDERPLPRFPRHRDDNAWDDDFHDYAILGSVGGIEDVRSSRDLRIDLKAELKNWAAAAIELYVREESEEIDPAIDEEAIAQRANEFAGYAYDRPHQRFATRVALDDDRLTFGLYCRHDVTTGKAEALGEAAE